MPTRQPTDPRAPHPADVARENPEISLQGSNRADALETDTQRDFADMRTLAERTFKGMPLWARDLLRVRNVLFSPFGLKSGGMNETQSGKDQVALFPVRKETTNRIVLGLDDWHPDFRVIMERTMVEKTCRVRATALVQGHNIFGRGYFAVIAPFHRLVFASVLKNAI